MKSSNHNKPDGRANNAVLALIRKRKREFAKSAVTLVTWLCSGEARAIHHDCRGLYRAVSSGRGEIIVADGIHELAEKINEGEKI